MTGVNHIFFDLDHTLWDFDSNSYSTLSFLYYKYELDKKLAATLDEFYVEYMKINNELWHLYDHGKIQKEDLRVTRFIRVFKLFGFVNNRLAASIDGEYISICPTKGGLIEGTVDVLTYLEKKYQLHIITNGFIEIQGIKIKTSNIDQFFKTVTTGECAERNKPAPQIFSLALERAKASIQESIFIGDNPITDIKGANEFGMKTIWFNSRNMDAVVEPNYSISHLKELKSMF